MIEFEGITFRWLGHDGFLITSKSGKTICIDPFQVKGAFDPVDIIVSTHEHGDHCSLNDMKKFVSSQTEVIGIPLAEVNLKQLNCKKIHYVSPGDRLTVKSIDFEIVASYNINKFRSPGVPFHPKEDKKIGLIFEMDSKRIYHAGDTDNIPEMENIKTEVALLPVSGTYVMTASEAIEAAEIIKPKLAIPMHWGTNLGGTKTLGSQKDAEEFKHGVSCKVEIPIID